jgi:hypothetical protein
LQSAAIGGDPSTAVIGGDPSTARISTAVGGDPSTARISTAVSDDPSTARISFPFAMLNPADNQLDPSTANPEQVRQPDPLHLFPFGEFWFKHIY